MRKRKNKKPRQPSIIDVEVVESPHVKSKPKGTILYLDFMLSETRDAQFNHIKDVAKDSGYVIARLDIDKKPKEPFVQRIERWVKENGKPIATLRWDEHGGLYGNMKTFRKIAHWCYENKVAPLATDFAYFNHYSGYMFDLLTKEGDNSIKSEWPELDNNLIEVKDIKGKLGDYIRMIERCYERNKYLRSLGHLRPTYEIVGYTQSLMNRCRLPLNGHRNNNDPDSWMEEITKLFGGDRVMFKGQPAPFMRCGPLDKYRFFSHIKELGKVPFFHGELEQNASIATNADWVITNASGVTNEFVIGGLNVITTGESWFNDLGIFIEPNSWAELKDVVNDRNFSPPPNGGYNRLKWINWWVNHQFLMGQKTDLLNILINKFNERVS